jgi:tetratricopeptide (TPR) repeat protein
MVRSVHFAKEFLLAAVLLSIADTVPTGKGSQRFDYGSLKPSSYSLRGLRVGIGNIDAGQVRFENPSGGQQFAEPAFNSAPQQPDASRDPDNTGSKALDPNTQKELNKALEALRAGKPASAKKHLEWTSQVVATDPDVTYSWGMYYAEIKDWTNAESYWQKTLRLYPQYPFALAGMGQLALRNGNLPEAIDYLERAVQESPSTWHLEERLAEAYYLHQENDQAEQHAKHAIEISEDRASLAQLVLAKLYLRRNDSQSALGILETLLAHQPSGYRAEEAQRLVNSLRQTPKTTPQAADDLEIAKFAAFDPPSELVPPVRWMPPDVDEKIPAVEQGAVCPLQKIQEESSQRVSEFVSAVNSITATETLEHEVIDARGLPSKHESRSYTYVVSLQQIRPGFYKVEEYRNGKTGQDIFPDHLAMFGLTSLVMIFHPAYRDEYEFSCEGLSRWHGGKAWQVHFRQRPDKPARVRGYRVGNQTFSLALRGRAWIAVGSFQILSLETDLVSPVPQIPLNAEHISIQYAPVQFHESKKELWLPQSAELFVDFDVRRVHRSDHFSDYLLFSVDENQKISAPPPQ